MNVHRLFRLLRISLVVTGLLVLFFSGIIRFEDYLATVPSERLTAAVVPADVATLTNRERAGEGLSPLKVNPVLTQAAQLKAEDMAEKSYYAHIGPDGKGPLHWLDRVGYRYLNAGENLVIDRTTSAQAVSAWMGSATHRANIMRPQFTEVGIGVAEGTYKGTPTIFVVQVFATPNPVTLATAKPSPSPKPEPVRAPAPSLSVAPVPQTSIVTKVNVLTAPVVHQIAPVTKPVPRATTTVATTTATSSVTYVLPPEFFAPVQVPDRGNEVLAPYVPPQQVAQAAPDWISRTKAYLGDIYSQIPRFWE